MTLLFLVSARVEMMKFFFCCILHIHHGIDEHGVAHTEINAVTVFERKSSRRVWTPSSEYDMNTRQTDNTFLDFYKRIYNH